MNEFSAAIGLIQLKELDKQNYVRKKIAKRYFKEIQSGAKCHLTKTVHIIFIGFWLKTEMNLEKNYLGIK